MAKNDDLDTVLADLKRQRDDLDRRIKAVEDDRTGTADILERLKKWRERAEKANADASMIRKQQK